MSVLVSDGGIPPYTASTAFVVGIRRNFAAPQFEEDSYVNNILETETVGASVLRVVATDADEKVRSVFSPKDAYQMKRCQNIE